MSSPSPLTAALDRARACIAAGDPAGAQAALEYAVEVGRDQLGESDPAVLGAAHQLAAVHRQAGDLFAARRVLEEAFAAGQWQLGDADQLMLRISFDLGVVAEELGNRHEARRAFGRVAGSGSTVLGDDHWAVRRARAYLGDEPPTLRLELPAPPEQLTPRRVPSPPVESMPPPAARMAPISAPAAPVGPVPDRPLFGAELERVRFEPAAPGVRRPRSPALFAAITAGLAAVIAIVALVMVVSDRDDPADDRPNTPTLGGGRPPSDVRLRDLGTTIEVDWTDPTDGTVSFLITGGHPGELLRPMGQIGPGQTAIKLHGLNSGLDYCFAVVAVYSTTTFNTSPQSCTVRERPRSAAPSGS